VGKHEVASFLAVSFRETRGQFERSSAITVSRCVCQRPEDRSELLTQLRKRRAQLNDHGGGLWSHTALGGSLAECHSQPALKMRCFVPPFEAAILELNKSCNPATLGTLDNLRIDARFFMGHHSLRRSHA